MVNSQRVAEWHQVGGQRSAMAPRKRWCLQGAWSSCRGGPHVGRHRERSQAGSAGWLSTGETGDVQLSLSQVSLEPGCHLCCLEEDRPGYCAWVLSDCVSRVHAHHVATLRRRGSGDFKDVEKGFILSGTSAHPSLEKEEAWPAMSQQAA